MIEGVKIIPLKKIMDERGIVMHMLKKTDPHFQQFGEIYFSCIFPNAIKGWHLHKEMTLNYAVIVGNIKLVLYDNRKGSTTYKELQEIFIGEDNYCLVQVPPGIINGFKAVGNKKAIVANCATHPYDPNEIVRIDPFDKEIGYNWNIKHG
ncbi:MAG: dTDP-4-dehydrorhamnose 3,5-epimerase family protein [Candidatus Helarchaeota archaeon]